MENDDADAGGGKGIDGHECERSGGSRIPSRFCIQRGGHDQRGDQKNRRGLR